MMLPYAALAVLALFYLQTFVSMAYDIRKAGEALMPGEKQKASAD
jgi:hypothetical protein